jgi:hypothetical protein
MIIDEEDDADDAVDDCEEAEEREDNEEDDGAVVVIEGPAAGVEGPAVLW